MTPLEPSEAIYFSRNGIINAGLIFFALMIISTAIFGRFFCGWACHLVALQDLSRWLLGKVGIRPKPLRSRLLAWVPTLAFLYMFIWPAAHRLWVGGPLETTTELTTSAFWATFPGWIVGITTLVVTGFLSVYFLGAKGFCFYACPYGAILAGVDRLSPMRIRVNDNCEGCGHCTAVCSANVRVHQEVEAYGMVASNDCMKCLDCVSVCPNQALSYGFGRPSLGMRRKQGEVNPKSLSPKFSEEILLGFTFLAGFLAVRGLYGWIPFLLSLGIAGVFSYLSLTLMRIFTRDNLSFRSLRLKHRGEVEGKGWIFLFGMGVLFLLWAHASMIRYRQFRLDDDYPKTDIRRTQFIDTVQDPPPLVREEALALASMRREISEIHRLGFLPVRGYTARAAWLDALLNQEERAIQGAHQALDRGEDEGGMRLLLAAVLYRQGNLDDALMQWREAARLLPYRVEPYLNPGVAMAEQNRLAEADEFLSLGMQYVPQASVLCYNRGLIRAMRGDSSAAVADFETTLEFNPSHLLARENIAGILAELKRYSESAFHYRQVLALNPRNVDSQKSLVEVLHRAGDREDARRELEKARDIVEDSQWIETTEKLLGAESND